MGVAAVADAWLIVRATLKASFHHVRQNQIVHSHTLEPLLPQEGGESTPMMNAMQEGLRNHLPLACLL